MRINISSAIAKMIVKNEVHVNATLTLLEFSPENHQKPEELAMWSESKTEKATWEKYYAKSNA